MRLWIGLKGTCLNLPETRVEPAGSDNELRAKPLAEALELRDASEATLAVDREVALAAADDQLELVPRRLDLGDLNSPGRDGPGVAAAADGLGSVRRFDGFLDGLGEGSQRVVRFVLVDEEIAVGKRDEVHRVSLDPRGLGRGDRVPEPRARDAVDTRGAPVRAGVDRERVALGEIVEAGLACELLVERLAPEDHCGSISP